MSGPSFNNEIIKNNLIT